MLKSYLKPLICVIVCLSGFTGLQAQQLQQESLSPVATIVQTATKYAVIAYTQYHIRLSMGDTQYKTLPLSETGLVSCSEEPCTVRGATITVREIEENDVLLQLTFAAENQCRTFVRESQQPLVDSENEPVTKSQTEITSFNCAEKQVIYKVIM